MKVSRFLFLTFSTNLQKVWSLGIFFLLFALNACNTSEKPPTNAKPKSDAKPIAGMVYFAGGKIEIGTDKGELNEQPRFETEMQPFYIDEHPVTVAQFREFVHATTYQTEAEKFGDAGVFNVEAQKWELTKGANWQFPEGANKPKAPDDHPVTQVSWNDANEYAKWAGKRLPTEMEWEYAAKCGENTENRYAWGNQLVEKEQFKANVFQGGFPNRDLGLDGFKGTNPIGKFGKSKCGMSDVGGNVWEWTVNTYKMYPQNPLPFQVDENIKVVRGGSFLCDSLVCHGYRMTARQFCSRETGLQHQGFRCAK